MMARHEVDGDRSGRPERRVAADGAASGRQPMQARMNCTPVAKTAAAMRMAFAQDLAFSTGVLPWESAPSHYLFRTFSNFGLL